MTERKNIGKIFFEIDKDQLQEITNAGHLSDFVEKATELFRQNLKAELVNSISSGSTSLVRLDDDYGYGNGGPRPHGPIVFILSELESISKKISSIEAVVNVKGR